MLAAIGLRFAIDGDIVAAERYTGGHINDTYFVSYRCGAHIYRYVHQRINTTVFCNPYGLSENVACVTAHIQRKLLAGGVPDAERRVLQLVPARDGSYVLHTDNGEYWRTYRYVEGTTARLRVNCAQDAYEAARGFGQFAAHLADLPPGMLQETISGFHDTPARFRALLAAIDSDACNRARQAKPEIAAAIQFEPLSGALLNFARTHDVPVRAAHNDTKITNVLFDQETGQALCIVDLDTVMPGLLLYDVGELIRTSATTAAEDEPDPGKVSVDPELFEAVAAGFLCGSQSLCSAAERSAFVMAGKVLAFENGIRFLTDYLEGDRYFRVHRSGHNLDRARAQFSVAASLESQEEELQRRVERASQAA
ncbi:MAG TPA: aminoglycoside phosphotransferase family protein [Candidatus Baltobacteraceae bacterium]|nr:aminoglycoside phosphotransferase family protein [Candidatus Baltobacteraceae bacterium]